ncbi:MAG TPA: ribosome biogenesis GTP-binding protein YihA/YsxC [bacterium]|nr:ribosome biogenesis GTP-binding protein YihA/YsxC [bacterium]
MKIVSAEFLQSAVSPRGFPPPFLPEVAFAGKSNVGKSSLINALLGRRNLVKTSATPGKTQAINFFLINERFRLVDLPGYGFAKVPLEVRRRWEGLVSGYLRDRPCLRGVVVILDARHDPSPLDRQLKDWLDAAGVEALYVANKIDKLKRREVPIRLKAMAAALELDAPPLACSAQTGAGRQEVWQRLGAWLREPMRDRSAS